MTTFNYSTGDPNNLAGGSSASMNDIKGPFVDLKAFINGANLDGTNIAASGVGTTQIAASSVTAAKLEAAIMTAYEGRKVHEATFMLLGGDIAGNYFPFAGGSRAALGSAIASPPRWFTIDPADIPAVTGKTAKLRLRTTYGVGATAPGVTFGSGLFQVNTITGGVNTIGIGTATSVPNSAPANIVTPGVGTRGAPASIDFDVPAIGLYCVSVSTAGTLAANSLVAFNVELHLHYV